MTEQPKADLRITPGGIHSQPSKMLVVALIAAAAATGALIITLLVEMPSSNPPPQGGPGGGGPPPPPPNMQSLAVFQVVTAFFVLAWLAVLVVFCRDQILRQMRQQPEPVQSGVSREELGAILADLRAEIAGDRAQDLQALGERIEEYGERRETDGYLNGMRAAAMSDRPEPNVRSFRRTPPQR